MPTSIVNQIAIAYTDIGNGFPLLLIHGFPLSRKTWEPQVIYLSMWMRVIAPDLRGHGETQAPLIPFRINDMALDMLSLFDALGIEKAIVCGLSMGGYVSLALYKLAPKRVKALILANTKAGTDSLERRAGRYAMIERIQKEGMEALAEEQLPTFFYAHDTSAELNSQIRAIIRANSCKGAMECLRAMAIRPSSINLLPNIQVPTLIIASPEDQAIPVSESYSMHREIPRAKIVLINNAGHLVNLERASEFSAAVLDFVQFVLR